LVFAKSDDGERFNLCIDEQFSGFNGHGRGERLFTDDGKPTTYVENILKFLQEYQLQFHRAERFCKRILELDLLEPMQAQVEMNSGEKYSLGGFMAVNREKLKELPGDKLAELAKTDELELIYLHLQSMRNFGALKDRLGLARAETATASPGMDETSISVEDNPEETKIRRRPQIRPTALGAERIRRLDKTRWRSSRETAPAGKTCPAENSTKLI
jgi:SapC